MSSGSATRSRAVPLPVYAAASKLLVVSAMALTLLPYEENSIRRTGNRAAHVNEIALDVDLFDPEIDLRVPLRAVMAGHFLALDDARRIGAWSDRAGTAVLRVTVRVRSTAEAPALHDALEAATLRRAGDLHPLADLEDLDRDLLADRDFGSDVASGLRVIEPEAAQRCRRRIEPRLLRVTDFRLRGTAAARRALLPLRLAAQALRAVSELHGGKAGLARLGDLNHRIRLGDDHRARNLLSDLIEYLGHAHLRADNADHDSSLESLAKRLSASCASWTMPPPPLRSAGATRP